MQTRLFAVDVEVTEDDDDDQATAAVVMVNAVADPC